MLTKGTRRYQADLGKKNVDDKLAVRIVRLRTLVSE